MGHETEFKYFSELTVFKVYTGSFAGSYINLQVYMKNAERIYENPLVMFSSSLQYIAINRHSILDYKICYDLFGKIHCSVIYNNASGSLGTGLLEN